MCLANQLARIDTARSSSISYKGPRRPLSTSRSVCWAGEYSFDFGDLISAISFFCHALPLHQPAIHSSIEIYLVILLCYNLIVFPFQNLATMTQTWLPLVCLIVAIAVGPTHAGNTVAYNRLW